MRMWLTGICLLLTSATLGQTSPVPERLVYELTHSILTELRPNALTQYKRVASGKYQWQRPMPNDTSAVRLLLLDHTDINWCKGLMCSFNATDSAGYEQQLLEYFSATDLAYMRQQLPAATHFVFRQAKIKQSWVHVVSLDTIQALRKRLGWQAHMMLGDSLVQRFGERNYYHISRIVFTADKQLALVNVGDTNGFNVSIYRKTGSAWRRENSVVVVDY